MPTVCDLSKVVQLLGEIAVLGDDYLSKKKFLMAGVCQLVDANSWVWALGQWNDERAAAYSGFLHGGFSLDEFAYLMATVEHRDNETLCADWVNEVSQRNGVVTRTKDELAASCSTSLDELEALLEKANISDAIISGVAMSDQVMSSFGFYRAVDGAKFSERDKEVVDLVLRSVSWLHNTGWEEREDVEGERLYPQHKKVVSLLLGGLSKKEIAQEMELAESTVSTYMKGIYKHYDVNSQVLLMRKLKVKNSSEI